MTKVTVKKLEAEIKFLIMTFEKDLVGSGINIDSLDYDKLKSARVLFKERVVGLIQNRSI